MGTYVTKQILQDQTLNAAVNGILNAPSSRVVKYSMAYLRANVESWRVFILGLVNLHQMISALGEYLSDDI